MIGDVVKMKKSGDYYVQINEGGTLQKLLEKPKWYRVLYLHVYKLFHKIKTVEETRERLKV